MVDIPIVQVGGTLSRGLTTMRAVTIVIVVAVLVAMGLLGALTISYSEPNTQGYTITEERTQNSGVVTTFDYGHGISYREYRLPNGRILECMGQGGFDVGDISCNW